MSKLYFRGAAMNAGKPTALLTLAADLAEMKTICACARTATMNLRFDAEGRRTHGCAQASRL